MGKTIWEKFPNNPVIFFSSGSLRNYVNDVNDDGKNCDGKDQNENVYDNVNTDVEDGNYADYNYNHNEDSDNYAADYNKDSEKKA